MRPLWYVSFSADSGWLGACYVELPAFADDMSERDKVAVVISLTHAKGINPGGEARLFQLPDYWPRVPVEWRGRLLDRDGLAALDVVMKGKTNDNRPSRKENGEHHHTG